MAQCKLGLRLDSIPGITGSTTSLRRALQTAASLGVQSVELCGRSLVPVSDLSETGVRTLRKIFNDVNLRIASIRFTTRRGFDVESGLDRRVEATKTAMRAAYRLGAPLVINQIGRVPDSTSNVNSEEPMSSESSHAGSEEARKIQAIFEASGVEPPSGWANLAGQDSASNFANSTSTNQSKPGMPRSMDPRWDTLQSVMSDLGRYGARVGSLFAAETGTESGPALAALLDSLPDAFVAVAFNPGQLIVNQQSIEEAVKTLRSRIRIVNAVDGVLDLSAGRGLSVPVGQGTADFPSLLGMLEDIPYRGDFIVGRDNMPTSSAMPEIKQSLEYLGNL